MPEVIFPGPEGRLEGRFSPGPRPRAPVALILHPHPQGGGTMNNAIVLALYKTFVRRGFATLRFNFRGVGKSQGVFDNGIGELSRRRLGARLGAVDPSRGGIDLDRAASASAPGSACSC